MSKKLLLLLNLVALTASGCGTSLSTLLGNGQHQAPKVPCPGDHTGFYVCMSDDSTVSDQTLAKTMATALASLATLVNSKSFMSQISSGLAGGQSVDDTLGNTNYTVTITGFCDASSQVLAQAPVGGNSVQYNECTVSKDANGQPDLAEVSGVLLHEISHNLGYTHPDINPSRSTIPYYLGDTATSDLDTGSSSTTGTQGSPTTGGTGPNAHHRGRNTWND